MLLISAAKRLVRATFDYTAIEDNDLTLKVGDVVEVLRDENKGWWIGQLKGKLGLFPSNYVEEAPASADPVIDTDPTGTGEVAQTVSVGMLLLLI